MEAVLLYATAIVAVALPALVGAAVKLHLDARGLPTLEWVGGALGLLPVTSSIAVAWLAWGFLCGWLSRRTEARPGRQRAVWLMWLSGLVGGAVALSPVLFEALHEAAYVAMIAVLRPDYFWRYVLGGALLAGLPALALGVLVDLAVARRKTKKPA